MFSKIDVLEIFKNNFLQNTSGRCYWKSFTRKVIQRNMEKEIIKIELYEDNCLLDEVSRTIYIFDFVAVSFYIAIISFNSSEPINYQMSQLKKGTSNQKLQDRYGHIVFSDENSSRGFISKKLAQKILIEKGFLHSVY